MYKMLIVMFFASVLLSCTQKEENKSYPFYIGTYTDGESQGIYHTILHQDGSFDSLQLAAKSSNPSFLSFAHGKKVLVAVNEVDIDGVGTVESYHIGKNKLILVDSVSSGGAHPCHININADGDIAVANYTGGNVGLTRVAKDGQLSSLLDVAQHSGQSLTERQTKPHAHSAWFTSEGQELIAVDLGVDQLIFYRVENDQLVRTDSLCVEAGAGPRHLAFHPTQSILYSVNELNSTISVISKEDQNKWELVNSISTLPDDFKGKSFCADIHISPDGRFLYASNRGHNSLVVYRIDDSGKKVLPIAYELVKGEWPRNFSLTSDGEFLIVANQHSNNLVSFKRDKSTGLLSYLNEVKADKPVCILFE